MARQNDRNSNRSSFSFLLGSAPHLDMNYTIFGCGVAVCAGCAWLRACVRARALQRNANVGGAHVRRTLAAAGTAAAWGCAQKWLPAFACHTGACTATPRPPRSAPCSKVTKGMDVLHKLESLPTHRQGMFVMPNERVSILGTYWYNVNAPFVLGSTGGAAAAATKP
jgi:cyclophilin family peptidyl-prolyl cis-trans isomerase